MKRSVILIIVEQFHCRAANPTLLFARQQAQIYLYTKEFFFCTTTLPFSLMRCLQGAEPMNLLFCLIPQEVFRLSLARTSPLDALYGANHFKKKKPQL